MQEKGSIEASKGGIFPDFATTRSLYLTRSSANSDGIALDGALGHRSLTGTEETDVRVCMREWEIETWKRQSLTKGICNGKILTLSFFFFDFSASFDFSLHQNEKKEIWNDLIP